DRYPQPRPRANVRMHFSDMPRVLGIEVAPEETLDILRRLQFTVAADGDTLIATPPAVRTDIAIAEDIVEEVGRIAGYDRLPTRLPDGPLPLADRDPSRRRCVARKGGRDVARRQPEVGRPRHSRHRPGPRRSSTRRDPRRRSTRARHAPRTVPRAHRWRHHASDLGSARSTGRRDVGAA